MNGSRNHRIRLIVENYLIDKVSLKTILYVLHPKS
jgi:hypothetical protein